jgi:hypothetical protein
MHFVPFPAFTEAQRFAGLARVDVPSVGHGPAAAVAASGVTDAARVRLVERSDGPVYLVASALRVAALHAADLSDAAVHAPDLALAIAADYARRRGWPAATAEVAALAPFDQWTVAGSFEAHRPLYRIALNDEAAVITGAPAWDAVPRDELQRVSAPAKEVEWFTFGQRIYRREGISVDQQRLFLADARSGTGIQPDEVDAVAHRLARGCEAAVAVEAADAYRAVPVANCGGSAPARQAPESVTFFGLQTSDFDPGCRMLHAACRNYVPCCIKDQIGDRLGLPPRGAAATNRGVPEAKRTADV